MFATFVLAAAISAAHGAPPVVRNYTHYNFEAYLKEFGKGYASFLEYRIREKIFNGNLLKVQTHNAEYFAGAHTWFAAINHLADFTTEEYRAVRGAKQHHMSQHPIVDLSKEAVEVPEAVDWREKGAITPVKNQGGCGSCWAFSATETLESHYQIASGKLVVLAPQTFVNCVKNPHHCGGTGGCEGATMELAFNLTVSQGVALEKDIPYSASDETCKPYKAAVKCSGYVKNPVNNALAFQAALARGPQAITVAAGAWQLYGGGLFHGCSHGFLGHQDNTLDHGVQAVGFTKDYWIVRNSWGEGWGENGFIRLSRASDAATFVDKNPTDGVACEPIPKTQTVGGECGILFDTSYPLGVKAATDDELIV